MELQPKKKYHATEQRMLLDAALEILPALLPLDHNGDHAPLQREERVKLAYLYAEDLLRAIGLIK